MAYRISDRLKQDKISARNNDPDRLDFGKLATVFFVFGLVSIVTAWMFDVETGKAFDASFKPDGRNAHSAEMGPIVVKQRNTSYAITVKADLSAQSWAYISGEVLDEKKEYLFSFAKELSYYSGRDSEGAWKELNDDYTMDVTFPKKGTYYLKFSIESDRIPRNVKIKVAQKVGSSMPHMWYGIILIFLGIVMMMISDRNKKMGRV